MRIGIIAPPWLPVPPPAYGGTEQVIDNLARGLQERGHDVKLFTVGNSTCPVPRDYLYPAGFEPMGEGVAEAAHVLAAYEAFADADIIHDHTMLGPLLAGRRGTARPPVVTTNHGPFTRQARRLFADIAGHAPIVAISYAHARTARVPIAAVIHHGIDLQVNRQGPGDGGYLLFVGRMCADKGVHHAVRVAQRAGQQLVITARIGEPGERAYFEERVRPLLGRGVYLSVPRPGAVRLELMRHAAALLNPITWAEPFGLVMAEALAAGTPVLAFPNGAAPEIVEDGKTGYLCHSEQDMTAAVRRVPRIHRGDCRAAAEQRFSAGRMVADYERLYRRIVRRPGDFAATPQAAGPARLTA